MLKILNNFDDNKMAENYNDSENKNSLTTTECDNMNVTNTLNTTVDTVACDNIDSENQKMSKADRDTDKMNEEVNLNKVKIEKDDDTTTETESVAEDRDNNSSVADNNVNNESAEIQATKRNHSLTAEVKPEVKKIKTEAESKPIATVAPCPQTIVAAPIVEATSSNIRERCMYGESCYRRNPQHLSTYSHPGDQDYGSCDRPPCQWGARCIRRNPRHWLQYDHPPQVQPPTGGHRGRPLRVVQRFGKTFYINANAVHFHDDYFSVEDSDGEDEFEYDSDSIHKQSRQTYDSEEEFSGDGTDGDLIVTGKRVRKKIVTDSYSDSESQNEDPFSTDDSDEWTPNDAPSQDT